MDEGTPSGQSDLAPAQAVPPAPNAAPKVLAWTLVAVLLAGAGVGGYFAFREFDRQRDARTALSEASALLEAAEDDLLKVDEAVQTGITSVTSTQAVEAAALADEVRADASEAAVMLRGVLGDLSADQLELAEALIESAEARADMMEIAPTILEVDARAAEAIVFADQAVAEIKAAEELSTQAAAEFNKHTADAVRASDNLSSQAEGRLNTAASLLATATAVFPGAEFTPFSSYIDAKLGLIGLAKEIDALWLAGDIAGSNAKLSSYNQRDAEVVALAQALPASVRDPIANAYDAQTADAFERYFEARERARVAGDRVTEIRRAAISSD
ncbi:MAG: hypothetical protein ACYC6J_04475 [Coriobacteriia bacterium]